MQPPALQKLCRQHGILRWPYRHLTAHSIAPLRPVAGNGSGTQAGGAAAQAGASCWPLTLSQPGTPAAAGPGGAPRTARAGSAYRSPFLTSAGSGSSSMRMLMQPGSGSGQAALQPGSGSCEHASCGACTAAAPALQRSYTPFVAPAGGSSASGGQPFAPHATRFAPQAADGGLQRDSGSLSPLASAASLKALLKRATALAGEEGMLQVCGLMWRVGCEGRAWPG